MKQAFSMKNIHEKLEVLKDEMKKTNRYHLIFASFDALDIDRRVNPRS